ncbi:6-hydroxymethylpterin diphosphokinase MptE-like protein [Shewanella algae]|uniref:6-hydroxymethylpterin diphosphokinase MptE-like protein n=1 Tax=Shewanella algae TaxID=38313 RepID=UPI001AAD7387|nr:6-hydroxymethylpterin diphosphokinase MptE-like protein [Shewanella algae]QTE85279.1 DUF115 domain-containing protein [Shewanella algae]
MSLFYSESFRSVAKKFISKKSIPYKILEEPFWFGSASVSDLKKLKDKFKGQRCFILGNGPSLNKCDLELLKNEYSFGVNGIFYKTKEMGYKPTFYVVEDSHVMKDNRQQINDYDVEYKFFPVNYKSYIKNRKNTYFFKMNEGFYVEHSPNYCVPRFSADISSTIFCGQSVTMLNFQIAYYLGFSEIYLIGMDFSYDIPKTATVNGNDIISNEDDVNHFHPDYFGKGKTWHDPHLDRVLNSYKMMKTIYEADSRRIFNATVGGKLEVFERVEYGSLF